MIDPGRYLRVKDVAARIGRSPRQIYRMVDAGDFPRQHRQSHKVAVWYERDVQAWQSQQMAKDLLSPQKGQQGGYKGSDFGHEPN